MTVQTIAVFHSPLTSKFGTPRQSGIVEGLKGDIVFNTAFRNPDFVRGLEGFDYIWLLWLFSENSHESVGATVRPPLLGGNEAVGVFATRSPYRPNPIGLSSVKILDLDYTAAQGPVIHVEGADLIDGTPIIDIKPYVEYADSHVGVKSGFVDSNAWHRLEVRFSEKALQLLTPDVRKVVAALLEQDPRPHYHNDPTRIYGMPFDGRDIRFRVQDNVLTVLDVIT